MPRSNTTLCIVDMQPCFKATEQAIPGVLKEIERAKKNNDTVIVLEYTHRLYKKRQTIKPVLDALKDYRYKVAYVNKIEDDGSTEFLIVAKKLRFKTEKVRVVGVNREACVFATVDGLSYSPRIKSIEVVLDATWGASPDWGTNLLNRLVKDTRGKVAIV